MAHAKYETKCFSCDRNWRFERRPDRSRAGFGFIWNKSPFRHRRRVNRPPSGSCRRCCRLCARYFPAFFYRDVSGNCLLRGEPLAGFFERALVDLWLVLRRRNRSSNDANRFAALGSAGAWSLQTSRPASRHRCTHDYRRAPDFLQRVAVREAVSGLDQFITHISLGKHHFAHRFQTKPRITQMKQIGISLLSASLIFAVTGFGQDAKSAAHASPTAGDAVYARPGQLVSVEDGTRLNLYCMGSGSPTVVFDSGWEDWAPAWSKVQPEVAKFTRACSYDRAGVGFSDAGPMPRTSVRIAEELHSALHNAGIPGPYILVGSAFGGDNVRTFADLYMGEVAGLVLVDADPDDLEPKAMREEAHRAHAGVPSDLRDCRNLIAEHKSLRTQRSGSGRPPQTCAQQFFFRGLPEAEWSPELNAKVLEIAQTKVAMYDAYSSEMEQTAADETYLQEHRRSFGSRPIRVLTSSNHGVGNLEEKPPDTPKHLKYEQETTLAQARWRGLSSEAKQIFARNSSEYIQFDEPETVINAIREVYDQSKQSLSQK